MKLYPSWYKTALILLLLLRPYFIKKLQCYFSGNVFVRLSVDNKLPNFQQAQVVVPLILCSGTRLLPSPNVTPEYISTRKRMHHNAFWGDTRWKKEPCTTKNCLQEAWKTSCSPLNAAARLSKAIFACFLCPHFLSTPPESADLQYLHRIWKRILEDTGVHLYIYIHARYTHMRDKREQV